ncbi:MAG TPA: MFS transporter [Streptosporangiaceae bacterium]|jgi:EmrB/QacA subfamily drug resistance transporter|nr:MFS transporter [Streptosporangiaceae bacterium]
MTPISAPPDARPARRRPSRPGLALLIMLSAQLMVVLDMTVVNIALPHIATGLHFSSASLSWVMNGYTLAFGGLLLLGGRAGDILGRRRVFVAGIALFTAASLAGGLATSAAWLLAARAAQGVGGALASPAVLALIISAFPEGRPRTRALAIYTGVITGGSSLGLVLGGLITQWLDWRWVLFINVPIGIAVVAITPLFVTETPRQPGRFDLAGAVTSTAGVAALVFAFIQAASRGWGDATTVGALAAAAALLTAFGFIERRVRQPITPLRLFTSLSRSGSLLARLLLVAGMFGMFFFLTQFVQEVLGFSPLRAGVAFLPLTIALFAVSRLAPTLVARFPAKPLMVAGLLPVIAAMAWLSRVSASTGYLTGLLGPMLLLGTGIGVVFVPLTTASLAGVAPEDSGAAASLVNVMQQVGGSVGLAALVSVFGTATRSAMAHPRPGLTGPALTQYVRAHGTAVSFGVAAVFDVCALLLVLLAIRGGRTAVPAAAPEQPRLVRVGDQAD